MGTASRHSAILCAALSIALLPAPAQTQNPFSSAADVALGRKLYLGRCGHCHGQSGEGGRGATLSAGRLRHGSSDRDLFSVIRNGIPNTEMPGTFSLPEAEVWRMVAFVKTLAGSSAPESVVGDPQAGRYVYQQNACSQCHTIGVEGGIAGPDLTGIGAKRAARHLRQSIVNPNADIPLDYRSVVVTTLAGKKITGIHLNEDEYSIHLRDSNGKLLSYRKSELKEIRLPRESLMPAYAALAETDLSNLVSYLNSLRHTF